MSERRARRDGGLCQGLGFLYKNHLYAWDKRRCEGSEGPELQVTISLTHAALGPALQQALGEGDACLCSEISFLYALDN